MAPSSPEAFKEATRQAWERSAGGWNRQTPRIHDWRSQATADLRAQRLAAPFRLASASDYLDFIRSSASPILQTVRQLDPASQEAAWAGMQEKPGVFQRSGGWEGPNQLLLAVGRKPAA